MSLKVGVIGLGPMGGNIAGNLLKKGFDVVGYDIKSECMDALDELGLERASSATDVAERADLLACSLPNASSLQTVIADVLKHPKPGQIMLECSTLNVVDKLAAHEKFSAGDKILLDAPISGTPPMLVNMVASIYVSGDEAAYEKCVPVLEGFTATNFYCGEVGNGTRMKLCANYLVHVHVVAAAECIVMGQKAGLDPELIQSVLIKGAGGSKMLEVRGAMMAKSDYREGGGTMFDVFEKDASIITEHAATVRAPIELYVSARQKLNSAIALGLGHLDTSAVCKSIEMSAGIARDLVE